MKQRFIVISIFLEGYGRSAQVGLKDPNISRSSVDDLLDSLGMNRSFHSKVEIDPMWYLMVGDRPVGYVRVFDEERWARKWFCELRDQTGIWAYWYKGFPVLWMREPKPETANQFVSSMALCSVRAFTAHGAAKSGWENWTAGRLKAIEVYLSPDRTRNARVMPPKIPSGSDRVSVTSSGWEARDTRVVRSYVLSGLPPPPATATFMKISCFQTRYGSGVINTELDFHIRPHLHLQPWGPPSDIEYEDPSFTVAFLAGGSEGGFLMEGTECEVWAVADPEGEEPDTMSLRVKLSNDVWLCVRALSTGNALTFAILNKMDRKVKLRLELPNDADFGRLPRRRGPPYAASISSEPALALRRVCQSHRGNRCEKCDDVDLAVAAGFFQNAANVGTDCVQR
jgi:hypothetical protein